MIQKLYGDGIHPDTDIIQALLDTKSPLIELPVPNVCYLIDRPLLIHSNQELRLPRYCHIKLAGKSDCHMLENADPENGSINITVSGGIWDYNNLAQSKNPITFRETDSDYDGIPFFLININNLILSDITFKDPTTFACTLDTVSYFTVKNIIFDFNLGNPRPVNMDGIHLNGNCHYGTIRNLKGTCYDDLVALNADEGSDGPIDNIDIDGIYSTECHSAVRILTVKNIIQHIHIHNVYGTFYQYGIGITKFYKGKATGYCDSIVLDNLYISKATRYSYLHVSEDVALHSYVYPLIYIESQMRIHNLSISEFYRIEEKVASPTILVAEDCEIDNLSLRNCYSENRTNEKMLFFDNHGKIKNLIYENNRITNDIKL